MGFHRWKKVLYEEDRISRSAATAIALHGFKMEVIASGSDCPFSEVDVGTYKTYKKTITAATSEETATAEATWLTLANSANSVTAAGYVQDGAQKTLKEPGCHGQRTVTNPSPLPEKNTPGEFDISPVAGGGYSCVATINIEIRTHTGDPCPGGPQT